MPFAFYDHQYLLFTIPPLLLSIWAQFRVKSTFHKYSQVALQSRMSGAEAAQRILAASGMSGLSVERHSGFLSDHYDPRTKTLRLSPDVYDGRSVASVAVAAHEAGHSLQDAASYGPLVLRSQLVPITQIGAQLWFWPFLAGLAVPNLGVLMWVGIALFALCVLFQLVTLPTEYDASRRAKAVLASTGIVTTADEARGVERVLSAAALTYVAALIAAVMQLVWMLLRARDR